MIKRKYFLLPRKIRLLIIASFSLFVIFVCAVGFIKSNAEKSVNIESRPHVFWATNMAKKQFFSINILTKQVEDKIHTFGKDDTSVFEYGQIGNDIELISSGEIQKRLRSTGEIETVFENSIISANSGSSVASIDKNFCVQIISENFKHYSCNAFEKSSENKIVFNHISVEESGDTLIIYSKSKSNDLHAIVLGADCEKVKEFTIEVNSQNHISQIQSLKLDRGEYIILINHDSQNGNFSKLFLNSKQMHSFDRFSQLSSNLSDNRDFLVSSATFLKQFSKDFEETQILKEDSLTNKISSLNSLKPAFSKNNIPISAWTKNGQIFVYDGNLKELWNDENAQNQNSENGQIKTDLLVFENELFLTIHDDGKTWMFTNEFEKIMSTFIDDFDEIEDNISQLQEPNENICPIVRENQFTKFGIKLDEIDKIPAVYAFADANYGDIVRLTDFKVLGIDPYFENRFHISQDRSSLISDLTNRDDYDSKAEDLSEFEIEVTVSDFNSDQKGFCETKANLQVKVSKSDDENSSPFLSGDSPFQNGIEIAPWPSVAQINALTGIVDPDGDKLSVSVSSSEKLKIIAQSSGEIKIQAQNMSIGEKTSFSILVSDSRGGQISLVVQVGVVQNVSASLKDSIIFVELAKTKMINLRNFLDKTATDAEIDFQIVSKHETVNAQILDSTLEIFSGRTGITDLVWSANSERANLRIVCEEKSEQSDKTQIYFANLYLNHYGTKIVDINDFGNAPKMNETMTIKHFSQINDSKTQSASLKVDKLSQSKLLLSMFSDSMQQNVERSSTIIIQAENNFEIYLNVFSIPSFDLKQKDVIAVDDNSKVQIGNSNLIDVLKNDSVELSHRLELELQDEIVETNCGSAFKSQNQIMFVSKNDRELVGKKCQIPYSAYNSQNHNLSSSAILSVEIVDIENSQDAVLDQEAIIPVNDLHFGKSQSTVSFSPYHNDIISEKYVVEPVEMTLISAYSEKEARKIEGKENIKKHEFIFGETGEETVWELRSKVTQENQKPEDINSEYEIIEKIILICSDLQKSSKIVASSQKIGVDDITNLPSFSYSFNDNLGNIFVECPVFCQNQDYNFELVNSENKLTDNVLSGKIDETQNVSHIVKYSTQIGSENMDGYFAIIIPSLNEITPKLTNSLDFKVQEGEKFELKFEDAFKQLRGANFDANLIQNDGESESCSQTVDGISFYVEKNDRKTTEKFSCAFKIRYNFGNWNSNFEKFTAKFTVFGNHMPPVLKNEEIVAYLMPGSELEVDISKFIETPPSMKDQNFTNDLKVRCDSNEKQIETHCDGIKLKVKTGEDADENSVYEFYAWIDSGGIESERVIWKIGITQTPRKTDLMIPQFEREFTIKQGEQSLTIDFTDDINSFLHANSMQELKNGSLVKCVNTAKFLCENAGGNKIKISVNSEFAKSGFSEIVEFSFADRSESENPNRGRGSAKVNYFALPLTPPPPRIELDSIKSDSVIFQVSSPPAAFPAVEKICVTIVENDMQNCVDARGNLVSIGGFEKLEKFKSFSASSFAVNAVGKSELSEVTKFTPIRELAIPKASWWIYPSGNSVQLCVQIDEVDSSAQFVEVNKLGSSEEIPAQIGSKNCAQFGLGQSGEVKLRAKTSQVQEGDSSVEVTPSENKVLNVVSPSAPELDGLTVEKTEIQKIKIHSSIQNAYSPNTKFKFGFSSMFSSPSTGPNCSASSDFESNPLVFESNSLAQLTAVRLCVSAFFSPSGLQDLNEQQSNFISTPFSTKTLETSLASILFPTHSPSASPSVSDLTSPTPSPSSSKTASPTPSPSPSLTSAKPSPSQSPNKPQSQTLKLQSFFTNIINNPLSNRQQKEKK